MSESTGWAMYCNDGCALTVWPDGDEATHAVLRHVEQLGHRVVLVSPRAWIDPPGGHGVSVTIYGPDGKGVSGGTNDDAPMTELDAFRAWFYGEDPPRP